MHKEETAKMQNPFTYTFGVKPREYIHNAQSEVILRNFSYEDPVEKASFFIWAGSLN